MAKRRRRQDSNLRGQSPVDFESTPLTAWVRLPHTKVGDAGYRSLYLSHAERALYHLSYTPTSPKTQTAGFEPAHAEHTRLAGEPRNHLGTSASLVRYAATTATGLCAVVISHGVVVSTQDPESCDRGSNPRGRTFAAPTLEKKGTPGFEPGTIRTAAECSTTELRTLILSATPTTLL